MNKPTVRYKKISDNEIEIGKGAFILTYGHPSDLVTEDSPVFTSDVLSYNQQTGDFETQNTKYVKIV